MRPDRGEVWRVDFALSVGAKKYVSAPTGRDIPLVVVDQKPEQKKLRVARLLRARDVIVIFRHSITILLPILSVGHFACAQSTPSRGAQLKVRLLTAVERGNFDVVKKLLDRRADPNARGKELMTPLMLASQPKETPIGKTRGAYWVSGAGRPALVKLLLSRGAKVDATDKYGRTALIIAAGEGMLDVARVLVKAQANVNARDNVEKATPLLWASINRHISLMRFLVENGADVNASNASGTSILMIAVSILSEPSEPPTKAYYEFVRLLLERGANVKATREGDGRSVLMWAAESFNEDDTIIRMLIFKGADIHTRDKFGATTLFTAAATGNLKITKALIDAGADVNAQDNAGATPLIWVAGGGRLRSQGYGNEKIVRLLLTSGANPNAAEKEGWTALHYLSQALIQINALAALKALLDAGANPNVRNSWGLTPLNAVSDAPEPLCTQAAAYLIAKGANINGSEDGGDTPLMRAVGSRRFSLVKLLINRGADVNRKDNQGHSPLYLATKTGQKAIIDLLHQAGARK